MDARERLRRYLEQRRELGESELVLDGMTVEEVLGLVGLRTGMKLGPGPGAAAREAPRWGAGGEDLGAPADHPRLRGEGEPAAQPPAPPAGFVPEVEERGGRARDIELEGVDAGDWRATLRASGASGGGGEGATGSGGDDDMAAKRGTASKRPKADPGGQPSDGMAESTAPGAAAVPDASRGQRAAATPAEGSPAFPGFDVPAGLSVGDDISLAGGPFDHLETLDAVARSVHQCTRCPLFKTATHGVPGEGNPDADFVVVGEAPGADEDASGRPFVGASGQLLTKILAAIKLAREDVFIANVVKHRPPGNRNPAPNEVEACSPYLVRQLELVRPKVILTVGNFAAQTLLGTKLGITKLRGQVHFYHGVPLVATYHPAALLRNPAWKRATWEDVQLARRILDRALSG